MPNYKQNPEILNTPSADDATLTGAIGGAFGGALGAMRPAIPSPARQALAAGAVGGRRQQPEPSQRGLFKRYAAEERSPELLNLLYGDRDPDRGSLYKTEEEFQADYQSWLASPRGRSYTGPNV